MDADPIQASVPTADEVREQLRLIVESADFAHQTKARQFLIYIVEQTLAGNERMLKQYSIATEALGREASFDPALDPVVRLEAGKLRKSLDSYYLRVGDADRLAISVPKGGYIPTFAYIDSTPEEYAAPSKSSTALDQSRLLVVAPSGVAEASKAIANNLFEQLTVELARYNDFAVVSSEGPIAVGQFGANPYELAKQYNARFLVTSSAAQSGNNIRVTIRLCDVRTETIIWIESFDFNLDAQALAEKQDRAARRVAADIADFHGVICRLLSVEAASREGDDWSAHTAMLRHRFLARVNNERVYRRTRADLEHGVEVAPNTAKLWAALAHTIFAGNVAGFDEDPDWLGLVERYAQHSFELDHRCAYGHVVAATLGIYNRDLDGTLEICRPIMQDNPHAPSTTLSAGFFRSAAGDWDTGARMLFEALEMISHPPGWAYRATFLDYYRQRDYSRALFEIKRYHATEHFTPSLLKAAALGQLGREEEARSAVRDVQRICPQFSRLSERYFRSITGLDSLVDHLKDGLAKAGLTL